MGLFKAFKSQLDTVGGQGWKPANSEIPEYAKSKHSRQQAAERQGEAVTAGELVGALATIARLREECAEALYASSQAEGRFRQLQGQAVALGHHPGAGLGVDAYAAGLPTPFTTGDFNAQALHQSVQRQQVVALMAAAQLTWQTARSNAQAKEAAYQEAAGGFEHSLRTICRENDVLRKEVHLLQTEREQIYAHLQESRYDDYSPASERQAWLPPSPPRSPQRRAAPSPSPYLEPRLFAASEQHRSRRRSYAEPAHHHHRAPPPSESVASPFDVGQMLGM